MELTVERLLSRLASIELPQATALAIRPCGRPRPTERRAMLAAALKDATPPDDVAQRTLVLAGLQVHFARLAALLRADDLKPVADGVCPTCGSAPVSSSVVGWPKAHNTRFCTCSLCATMWNVVRVKCVLCSSTEGIRYQAIEGESGSHQGRDLRQLPALRENPLPGQRSGARSRSPTTSRASASTCCWPRRAGATGARTPSCSATRTRPMNEVASYRPDQAPVGRPGVALGLGAARRGTLRPRGDGVSHPQEPPRAPRRRGPSRCRWWRRRSSWPRGTPDWPHGWSRRRHS